MTPEQMEAKANRLSSQADAIRGTVNDDYAYWTQPGGTPAFERQRARDRNRLHQADMMVAEAKDLRDRAERIRTAPERRAHQQEVVRIIGERNDAEIAVGDRVQTQLGVGEVVRKGRINYRVSFRSGFSMLMSKTDIVKIEEASP
ncbi:MAG: hypothetical protein RIC87_12545 [Kiloniellales bacterium]